MSFNKFCLHTLSGVVRFRKEVSFVMPLFYLADTRSE